MTVIKQNILESRFVHFECHSGSGLGCVYQGRSERKTKTTLDNARHSRPSEDI